MKANIIIKMLLSEILSLELTGISATNMHTILNRIKNKNKRLLREYFSKNRPLDIPIDSAKVDKKNIK